MLRTSLGAAAIVTAALLVGCTGSANVSSPSGEQSVMGTPPANAETQQQSTSQSQTAYQNQPDIREVPAKQGQYQGAQQAGYQQSNLQQQGQGNIQIQPQINSSTGDLRLVNNSDQEIRNIHVTANSNYTANVDRIPAHGSVILNRNDFSGPTGSLATSDSAVSTIKLDVHGQTSMYIAQQP